MGNEMSVPRVASVTRHCGSCGCPVDGQRMFCSEECRTFAAVVRDSVDPGAELTVVVPPPMSADWRDRLQVATAVHGRTVTAAVAAHVEATRKIEAATWAAAQAGHSERDIARAMGVRTVIVQQRIRNFQARMHGPAEPASLTRAAS